MSSMMAADLRLLRALSEAPRDNRWMQEHFGLGHAYYLARCGLVENPLWRVGPTHTNLWRLTDAGKRLLEIFAKGAGSE